MSDTRSDSSEKFSPRARAKARRCAVQALYQLHFNDSSLTDIFKEFETKTEFKNADKDYFHDVLRGIQKTQVDILQTLEPVLDRKLEELDSVELAVFKLAIFELTHHPEIPWRVILNEGIELAKMFGGEDSHKYINGVLERIAADVRAIEIKSLS